MSNLTTVSNATFDTAAAAVPLPFGPLTRVDSLDALPRVVPNSNQPVAVTGAGGLAFYISYDDMVRADVRDSILAEAYGRASYLAKLKNFSEILYREANNLTLLTATAAQIQAVMRIFQYYPDIVGVVGPTFTFEEIAKANKIVAKYTVSGSGASRTFLNTSTGYLPKMWFWDFGDSTYSFLQSPPAKTWSVDGTYVVRLIVAGHGGIDDYQTSIVVDVP